MPIVTVHYGRLSPRLHDTVPVALAEALGCPAQDVWVYGVEADERKGCAFVTVRARDEARVAAGLAAVAGAVAAALEVPLQDVWVHWMDLPPGRVFAGGAGR